MNEKRKIFLAIYIFYLGLYCLLSFYLKREFLFLITLLKTNNIVFSLNKVKLLLKIVSCVNKIIEQKLNDFLLCVRFFLDI